MQKVNANDQVTVNYLEAKIGSTYVWSFQSQSLAGCYQALSARTKEISSSKVVSSNVVLVPVISKIQTNMTQLEFLLTVVVVEDQLLTKLVE